MFKENPKLGVTYLTNQDTFRDIYNCESITFDGKNDIGLSPIVGVGICGSATTARLFLNSGIEYHKFDLVKALWGCAVHDNHEVADEILKKHSSLINTICPGWDITPLHEAASNNAVKTGKLLLSTQGILVNKGDSHDGDTPLHYAATKQATEMIKLLLGNGDVEVNALNFQGETPLFYAVNQITRRMEDIKLLIAHGADISRANKYEKLPAFSKEEYEEIFNDSVNITSHDGEMFLSIQNLIVNYIKSYLSFTH